MSIKEKALQLKQDFDAVHEAGKQKVISQSKYIPKSATGKVISLTDVSEVAHKVKVYGDNQEVDVYGKNLLSDDVYDWNNWVVYAKGGKHYYLDLPIGTYTVSTEITANLTFVLRKSADNWATNTVTYICTSTDNNRITFDVKEGEQYALWVSNEKDFGSLYDIQIEAGQYTPYEPFTERTITAAPTGTEIDSMCPNMNFIADSDITVDYYSSFGMAEKELAMWNALTNYGTRSNFDYAFDESDYTGYTIPTGLCKPRQRIGSMFYNYKGAEPPKGVDCSEFNVTDTTKNNHCVNTFAYAQGIKRIYDMLIPAVRYYNATYLNCTSLESIEIIRSNESTVFDTNCFNKCSKLTHCIFSGVIASDINLQWSKLLDEESLVSLAVSLAHLIETGENPEGTNVPGGLQFTLTVTLSEESKAILNTTLYPDTGISCMEFIKSVKGWNVA